MQLQQRLSTESNSTAMTLRSENAQLLRSKVEVEKAFDELRVGAEAAEAALKTQLAHAEDGAIEQRRQHEQEQELVLARESASVSFMKTSMEQAQAENTAIQAELTASLSAADARCTALEKANTNLRTELQRFEFLAAEKELMSSAFDQLELKLAESRTAREVLVASLDKAKVEIQVILETTQKTVSLRVLILT